LTVEITWHPAISLGTKATFKKRITDFDLSDCPEKPGLYIFARRFGSGVLQPVYIGKGENLRSRLKTQFNNHKLIEALLNEKSGERVLLLGEVKGSAPVALKKKLRLAERTHIEHALTAGYRLINVQLTKGQVDSVEVLGARPHTHPFPRIMLSKK
jgi:hypothetical protein